MSVLDQVRAREHQVLQRLRELRPLARIARRFGAAGTVGTALRTVGARHSGRRQAA
jgi:hypothetical protein